MSQNIKQRKKVAERLSIFLLPANAILSVSLSVARAQAISEKKPLYKYLTKFNPNFNNTYHMPTLQMNVVNGGKHANWATDIQEYMIIPVGTKKN